ncbi:MAG: chemotaxis protein CheW [Rhodospirillales bacterium]
MTVGAAVTPSVAAPERRGLLFRSADRTFAIDLRDALEIVTDVQFTALAIPQVPVAGDLILRSRVLAAIDPLTLLGVPDRTGAAFAIVTASGSGDVAVLAASILGVRALPEPQPIGWLDPEHAFGRAVTLPDHGLVLLLAADRLRLRQRAGGTNAAALPVSSSAADDGHVPGRRYLAFVRGPERFAVDAMAVGRICHAARAFRIPVTGRTRIREVIEVGSQVLPIVELPAPAAGDASLVLTLEAAGGPIAIRCDRIEGLIDIAAADVKRTPLADGRTLRTVRSGTTVYLLIGGEAAAGLLAVGGGVG